MTSNHIRSLVIALLGSLVATGAGAAETAPAQERARAIEQSIEQAREQLNEAARKLAELHSEMWRLETTGPRSDRPMLGILLGDAGTGEGLTLHGVTPDGGAEQAGLVAGDRIVEVNGVRIDVAGTKKALPLLSEAMADTAAGETVDVVYVRDGTEHEVEVVTQPRGRYMAKMVEEKGPWLESLQALSELADLEALEGLEELEILEDVALDAGDVNVVRGPSGLELEDVSGELASYFQVERGVLVMSAPAAQSLEAGDIILAVNGKTVDSAGETLSRLAELDGIAEVRIKRHRDIETVDVDVAALNDGRTLQVMRGDRRIRIQRRGTGEDGRLEVTIDD